MLLSLPLTMANVAGGALHRNFFSLEPCRSTGAGQSTHATAAMCQQTKQQCHTPLVAVSTAAALPSSSMQKQWTVGMQCAAKRDMYKTNAELHTHEMTLHDCQMPHVTSKARAVATEEN
mmetsp:Transcript_73695/g.146073  ORF Transcript_73695/g.146073 Transcript_73695/m.146073 type:complete len:119 (+) Transcript_73695:118-474(+)